MNEDRYLNGECNGWGFASVSSTCKSLGLVGGSPITAIEAKGYTGVQRTLSFQVSGK